MAAWLWRLAPLARGMQRSLHGATSTLLGLQRDMCFGDTRTLCAGAARAVLHLFFLVEINSIHVLAFLQVPSTNVVVY